MTNLKKINLRFSCLASPKKSLQALKTNQGIALITVLGLLFFIITLAVLSVQAILTLGRDVERVERANSAYFAAEAGVELALYDLAAYRDGYQTDKNENAKICGDTIDLLQQENFTATCNEANPYRFVNFTSSELSGARAFWQIFARSPQDLDSGEYVLPNPLFIGDKDGKLTSAEAAQLSKNKPLQLSLLLDENPLADYPNERYYWLQSAAEPKITFTLAASFDPDYNGNSNDPLIIWTLSAINLNGEEFTLQGIIAEADFEKSENEYTFIFDLSDTSALVNSSTGHPLIGEDINNNLTASTLVDGFNRIAGQVENFPAALSNDFLRELEIALENTTDPTQQWSSAELSLSLIATLAETSDIPSNVLHYAISSETELADPLNYIVAEGFARNIKKSLVTQFQRAATLPIFSYAVFQ